MKRNAGGYIGEALGERFRKPIDLAKKAAEKYANRYWEEAAMWPASDTSKAAFLAGVRWERRRRAKDGY